MSAKTKMTALARSIDLKPPLTHFSLNKLANK